VGRKLVDEDLGYSLVEVMVAMTILAIAILPMVGMFDMGLRASTDGGNYDQARALANQQMSRFKALSFNEAVTQYPPGATPACATSEPGFTCQIQTTYLNNNLQPTSSPTTAVQAVVTISWGGGSKQYTTTGLKTRGQQE
jgi:prepilin-type N-terminal cleavage/methylation domain-containing protein